MHTLALQAPAPPAPARTTAPPARSCPVCGEALRDETALRCMQCACGPFHPACARKGREGAQCPQCAQPAAAGMAGTARTLDAGERVYLTGARSAGGVNAGLEGGAQSGSGGGRARCEHGKQRRKCRECREARADGGMAQEDHQAERAAEQGEAAVGSERGRQRQRLSGPQGGRPEVPCGPVCGGGLLHIQLGLPTAPPVTNWRSPRARTGDRAVPTSLSKSHLGPQTQAIC